MSTNSENPVKKSILTTALVATIAVGYGTNITDVFPCGAKNLASNSNGKFNNPALNIASKTLDTAAKIFSNVRKSIGSR